MKKIIALLMVALMLVTMVACGQGTGDETTTNTKDTTNNEAVENATVGQTLLAEFKADSTGTAQEIADRLITHKVIEFMGAAMPVEEGLLSGFDNTEIKGFESGVMFAPMVGSIPFVGYIFVLPDGADVDAFKATLKDSANLRWNICVEAEELIVENEGNKVFFLMCPKSFEQPEVEGEGVADGGMDMPAEDMLPADDMIPAEDGITLE